LITSCRKGLGSKSDDVMRRTRGSGSKLAKSTSSFGNRENWGFGNSCNESTNILAMGRPRGAAETVCTGTRDNVGDICAVGGGVSTQAETKSGVSAGRLEFDITLGGKGLKSEAKSGH
jgi:hypothetical protein